jgi:hypothetical protein
MINDETHQLVSKVRIHHPFGEQRLCGLAMELRSVLPSEFEVSIAVHDANPGVSVYLFRDGKTTIINQVVTFVAIMAIKITIGKYIEDKKEVSSILFLDSKLWQSFRGANN